MAARVSRYVVRLPRGQAATRSILTCLLILVVGFGAHLAWRFATYGQWLPNTVVAKSGSSIARWSRGFDYVASNFLTTLDLWILLPSLPQSF